MERDIKQLTDKALSVAKAQDDVRLVMTRPYNHEDGFTYATDGTIILKIPTSMCNEYEKFEGCQFPNCKAIFDEFGTTLDGMLQTEDIADTGNLISLKIGNQYFLQPRVARLYKILKVLGISAVHVTFGKHMLLRYNDISILMCECYNGDGKLDCEALRVVDISYADRPITMDIESGFKFLETLVEEEQKETKRRENLPKIFTFTIARYATMYVSADNEKEARRIARSRCGEISDFDFDCPEIDSMDAGFDIEPDDSMETIYTEDDEFTPGEYEDYLCETATED